MGASRGREPDRVEFREFLVRVEECCVSVEEWNRFAIQRYTDPLLEGVRRRLADEVLARGQCSARTIPAGLNDIVSDLIAELDSASD